MPMATRAGTRCPTAVRASDRWTSSTSPRPEARKCSPDERSDIRVCVSQEDVAAALDPSHRSSRISLRASGLRLLVTVSPVQISQIAEAMNGQSTGVLHALIRKPLDMPRETAPRPHVQLVPGHAAVNLDRTLDRSRDVLHGHHLTTTYGPSPRSPTHWTDDPQSGTNSGMEKCS